jgi:D-proline reductase (dithiol) PrdB
VVREDRHAAAPLTKTPHAAITTPEEDAMNDQSSPSRTPTTPLREALVRWVGGTGRGQALGRWLGRTIALPQLRPLTADPIPWSPLQRPLSEATVALVTTAGVHLKEDRPFVLASDPTFRVIPRTALAGDLAISHAAYDRTDALRDLNLVFPLQRLREMEAAGAIGRVAEQHYGFGLVDQAATLVAPGRDVGRLLRRDQVDLALFVPA